ncbi:hypothetical protein TNCV_718731 [Trichonephila clavipes]|nr:hypothetical protein TNCV_718731 [Trichonephila clavipes]
MTSHDRLEEFLRWRAVGRLEEGRSQAEIAVRVRGLQVVSHLWNPFQTRYTITRNADICKSSLLGINRTTTLADNGSSA